MAGNINVGLSGVSIKFESTCEYPYAKHAWLQSWSHYMQLVWRRYFQVVNDVIHPEKVTITIRRYHSAHTDNCGHPRNPPNPLTFGPHFKGSLRRDARVEGGEFTRVENKYTTMSYDTPPCRRVQVEGSDGCPICSMDTGKATSEQQNIKDLMQLDCSACGPEVNCVRQTLTD